MILSLLLAMADMRGNLVAAAAVLAIGLIALRLLSSNHGGSKSRIWVPMAALIAGPLVGIGWWAFDVFVLAADFYVFPSEYFEVLPPCLLIGTFVGVVAALAFAIVYRVRLPKGN